MRKAVVCISGWAHPPDALKKLGEILFPEALVFYTCVSELCGPDGDFPLAKGLQGYLQREQLTPSVIIGWSMGAMVAVDALTRGWIRAEKLVMIASTLRFCADDETGVPAVRVSELMAQLRVDKEDALRKFFFNAYSFDRVKRAQIGEFMRFAKALPDSILQAGLQYLLTSDIREDFCKLEIPVLIIHGQNDTVVPVGAAIAAKAMRPKSELVIHSKAGHCACVVPEEAIIETIQVYVK